MAAFQRSLTPWLRSLVAEIDPRYVIGIARGAIRAIQLAGPGCLPEPGLLLSHTALPFLTDGELRDARVVVVDDSIVFGSTMAHVREYLLSRGALVFCAAYVADRTNFFGENEQEQRVPTQESPHSTLPIQVRRKLWPAAIRRHHAALVRLIVTGPLHYNLDFPTFCLGGASFQRDDLALLVNVLKSIPIVRKVTDVSPPAGADAGVFRYTGFLHDNCGLAAVAGARIRSVPKVRVSVLPSRSEIRLTPIVQIALPSRASVESIHFTDDGLDTAWRQFALAASPSDPLYHQALFRLVTATIGVELGLRFGREFTAACQYAGFDFQLGLLSQDLAVLLTPRNSRVLEDFVARECVIPYQPSTELENAATQAERELVPVAADPPLPHDAGGLAREVCNRLAQQPALRIAEADPPWEATGKVFLALRAATDSHERRRAIPDNSRIECGLSYDTLYSIVAGSDNPNLDHDEFGAALDLLVDRALVVPKVVRQGDEWLRAFYCGEDEEDQETLQFKGAFRDAYADFLSRSRRKLFSSFDLQKLSVVLKSQLSWLPLTLLPYKFGYVSAQFGTVPRIDWLTEGESSPCQEQIVESGKVLVPRDPYHRAIDLAWAPKDVRDFFDAFDFVASAFAALPDEAKLLMSTCRTHRHAFNAIAFELHAWCGHERSAPGFRFVPLLGKDLCGERSPVTLETLLRRHYWDIRFITEAEKKHDAFFHRFKPLRAKLEKQFYKQGAPAIRWWKMVMSRGLLDPLRDEEIRHRMEHLLPLLGQAKLLTQYCHGLLLETQLISVEQLELAFAANGCSRTFAEFAWLEQLSWASAAAVYNEAVARGQLPGKSIFQRQLASMRHSLDEI